MKGIIRKSSVTLLAVSLLLTGCGESMQELTAEEEGLVVAYASGAIGKANKHQAKGMLYVVPEEQEPEEEIPVQEKPVQEPEQNNPQTPQQGTQDTPEAVPKQNTATLTEALGMSPLTAEYKGYEVTDHYTQGSYYSLQVTEGNQYIILNITLSNPSGQPMNCDFLAKSPSCHLVINGELKFRALMTPLENDFPTFMETIEAGGSMETIAIFEITAEEAQTIQTLSMNLTMDGTEYNINLQ